MALASDLEVNSLLSYRNKVKSPKEVLEEDKAAVSKIDDINLLQYLYV